MNESLKQRITEWMNQNPKQRSDAERMIMQLNRVESEFDGAVREKLVQMVEETFVRHQEILESKRKALRALDRLTNVIIGKLTTQASFLQETASKKAVWN